MKSEAANGAAARIQRRAVAVRLASLFDQHAGMVLGLCRLLLRDHHEAEDAAQQTFVSAYRSMLNGSEPRDAAPWLAAIARNECRARIRRRMRAPLALETELEEQLSDPSDMAEEADRRAELAALTAAIADLPARQREAVALRDFLGLSYEEVASTLSVSVPVVESLLFRARRRLRDTVRTVPRYAAGLVALPFALRGAFSRDLPELDSPGAIGVAGAATAAIAGIVAKIVSLPFATKAATAVTVVAAATVAPQIPDALDDSTTGSTGVSGVTIAVLPESGSPPGTPPGAEGNERPSQAPEGDPPAEQQAPQGGGGSGGAVLVEDHGGEHGDGKNDEHSGPQKDTPPETPATEPDRNLVDSDEVAPPEEQHEQNGSTAPASEQPIPDSELVPVIEEESGQPEQAEEPQVVIGPDGPVEPPLTEQPPTSEQPSQGSAPGATTTPADPEIPVIEGEGTTAP